MILCDTDECALFILMLPWLSFLAKFGNNFKYNNGANRIQCIISNREKHTKKYEILVPSQNLILQLSWVQLLSYPLKFHYQPKINH